MVFTHSFHKLGRDFYQEITPEPSSQPELFLWNSRLQMELSLPEKTRLNAADYFSGNVLPEGALPLAQAYAGHQFGSYNPQLGDGRAHLLGELTLEKGELVDIQLKGSGKTRYSRNGDGRCALGPAIREYLMSEIMHRLGVLTTRTLAVVKTGDPVFRMIAEPGAVVTRTASSHIRVGTFQYHSASGNRENLNRLTDYSIKRHFPEIDTHDPDKALHFISAVSKRQVVLVTEWMRVGFIHGVMNTDNTAISGETIDYGPCAMMGIYDPRTVYSSIDNQGRYCFGNQPAIMQWNMIKLAESLIPIIDKDSGRAVAEIEPLIEEITELYTESYYQMMANKLGLPEPEQALTDNLLSIMEMQKMDYTQTFIDLMKSAESKRRVGNNTELADWYDRWSTRLDKNSLSRMKAANPQVIPRNHHIERIIEQCIEHNDPSYAEGFLSALSEPYIPSDKLTPYQDLPADGDRYYQTFCGT